MSYLNVYVGDSEDPRFSWEGRNGEIGNTPRRLTPLFPPSRRDPWSELNGRIESGEYEGRQIDWGASAAKVTKKQIKDFIADCYSGDPTYQETSTWAPHLVEKLREVLAAVELLNDDRLYALVASEL